MGAVNKNNLEKALTNVSTVTEIILKFNHNNYIIQLFFVETCYDCLDVAAVRQSCYNVDNWYDLFTNVAGDTIFYFLKVINLFSKIVLYSIRSKYMVLSF